MADDKEENGLEKYEKVMAMVEQSLCLKYSKKALDTV